MLLPTSSFSPRASNWLVTWGVAFVTCRTDPCSPSIRLLVHPAPLPPASPTRPPSRCPPRPNGQGTTGSRCGCSGSLSQLPYPFPRLQGALLRRAWFVRCHSSDCGRCLPSCYHFQCSHECRAFGVKGFLAVAHTRPHPYPTVPTLPCHPVSCCPRLTGRGGTARISGAYDE